MKPTIILLTCAAALNAQIPDTADIQKFDKMIVTATRNKTRLADAPGISQVIDRKDILSINASRPSDILNFVPGVDIETGTGVGVPTKKTISLGGLPSFHTVVLVDGKRLPSSHFHTGADVDIVPIEHIERIEIVRDGSSALYGSDALGGVANIITRKDAGIPSMHFGMTGGSQESYRYSLGMSQRAGERVNNSAFVSWDQSDGLPIEPINAQTGKPASRAGKLNYKQLKFMDNARIQVGQRGTIDASIQYAAMNNLIASNVAYDALLFTPGIDWSLPLSDKLLFSGLGYYSHWRAEMTTLEKHEYAAPQFWLTYSGLQKNAITAGAEYAWRNLEREGVVETSQNMVAGFVQDEVRLSDALRGILALRADYLMNDNPGGENIGPVFSPKVSVLYRPIPLLSLRAGGGRGFRGPHVQDLYESRYHPSAGGIWRYGNSSLNPEYSTSGNLGIEALPLQGLTVSAIANAHSLKDMIAVVKAGRDTAATIKNSAGKMVLDTVPVYERRNINNYEIQSIELEASYRYRWLTIGLGGGTSRHRSDDPASAKALLYPGSHFSGKAAADVPFKGFSLNAFLGAKKVFDRYSPGGGSLRDYTDLQAGIGVALAAKYEAFVKAENLLEHPFDVYEDALYTIMPQRRIEGGIRISVF